MNQRAALELLVAALVVIVLLFVAPAWLLGIGVVVLILAGLGSGILSRLRPTVRRPPADSDSPEARP